MLKKAYERLEPPVTPELLSGETKLTLEQVYACLEAMRFLKPEDWNDFDCVVHGSWKSQCTDPEHEVEKQEMQQLLVDSIKQLPERERLVLTLYYSEELNLAEIGKVIEISESRVSRILAAAKFRLKELVRSQTR
jgi:RNA polymerase sigma factor for flagellar operon FliA